MISRYSGGPFDLCPVGTPEVVARLTPSDGVISVLPGGAVKLFPEDVGMSGVPSEFTKLLHHHIEELHVGARPPRHSAGRVDGQRCDRLICVGPGAVIELDDLIAGLVFGDPVLSCPRRFVVPARHGVGERPIEDFSEVSGRRVGAVLDQAQEVGAGRGQRSTYVVLSESIELPYQRIAPPTQGFAETLFRVVIDHPYRLPLRRAHCGLPTDALPDSGGETASSALPPSIHMAPAASKQLIGRQRDRPSRSVLARRAVPAPDSEPSSWSDLAGEIDRTAVEADELDVIGVVIDDKLRNPVVAEHEVAV